MHVPDEKETHNRKSDSEDDVKSGWILCSNT